MANSLIINSASESQPGYQSRQQLGEIFAVTTPSLAKMTCMKMAIKLAIDHPQESVLDWRRPAGRFPRCRIHVAYADEDRRPTKPATSRTRLREGTATLLCTPSSETCPLGDSAGHFSLRCLASSIVT